MTTVKYYAEPDLESDTFVWFIMESEGGYELGATYDTMIAECFDKITAEHIAKALNFYWDQIK